MELKNLLILPLLVSYLQAASVDNLTFTLNSDNTSYTVSDCDQFASGSLVIPSTYDGLPVIRVGSYAFTGSSLLM